MTLFVDTSVWSLGFRRDFAPESKPLQKLFDSLDNGETIVTTGLVLQELLQGFSGPKARAQIVDRFTALPSIIPERPDHINAADLRNKCRRAGVQIGTIDALLAQLCIRHDLTMLTTDADFIRIAKHCPLKVWSD